MSSMPSPVSARKTVRADRWTRAWNVFVGTMVTVSLAVLMFLAIQDHYRIRQNERIQAFIKSQAVSNGQQAHETKQLAQSIQDCTQASGRCYQRNARAQHGAVSSINTVVVAAAGCAAKATKVTDSPREIEATVRRCVVHRLAK